MMEGWLKELAKYGPIGLVCAVLLYSMIWEIKPALAEMQGQHATIVGYASRMDDTAKSSALVNDRILRVLLAQCVNAAKTDQQRRDCLQ